MSNDNTVSSIIMSNKNIKKQFVSMYTYTTKLLRNRGY